MGAAICCHFFHALSYYPPLLYSHPHFALHRHPIPSVTDGVMRLMLGMTAFIHLVIDGWYWKGRRSAIGDPARSE